MNNYCITKGMICHNCNEYGNCQITGCSYPDATTTATLKTSDIKYSYGRECQICGKITEGLDDYICPECKRKLEELIVNSDDMHKFRFERKPDTYYEKWLKKSKCQLALNYIKNYIDVNGDLQGDDNNIAKMNRSCIEMLQELINEIGK